jgi:hypothetical protein
VTPHEVLGQAISEADRLRRVLKKGTSRQVSSVDECQLVRSTALSWFHSHAPCLKELISSEDLSEANGLYRGLFEGAGKATTRARYDSDLKKISREIKRIQSEVVSGSVRGGSEQNSDLPPDFSSLISDKQTQLVLTARWLECSKCVLADAPLAATVMMGGLLETLLLARINREPTKDKVFSCKSVPHSKQTGKALPLQEWGLRNYIDVAHELKWITASAKEVGEVLRDYRNYIHPYKQIAHGVEITRHDAVLFWNISKIITRQLIELI